MARFGKRSRPIVLRLRDYACTLLVVVVGTKKAALWQIGDGPICFRTQTEDGVHYAFWQPDERRRT
ncbi:protein phosphatase 2C domain-containing protein [Edaphobacter paludis]|uniref:protein phosphatase 2C domain-containing protein n=1 Tax=Edaphobacter paludis TaxID=3035702 RepID=UPI0035A118D3